jgi:hypothetical protein
LKAASAYAPPPEGSAITYGFVGVALFAMIAWGVAEFYSLALLPHVAVLGACALGSFVIGVWLRRRRRTLHDAAYRTEFAQRKPPQVSRDHGPAEALTVRLASGARGAFDREARPSSQEQ